MIQSMPVWYQYAWPAMLLVSLIAWKVDHRPRASLRHACGLIALAHPVLVLAVSHYFSAFPRDHYFQSLAAVTAWIGALAWLMVVSDSLWQRLRKSRAPQTAAFPANPPK